MLNHILVKTAGCSLNREADVVFGLYNLSVDQRADVTAFIKSVGGELDHRTSWNRVSIIENTAAEGVADTLKKMRHAFGQILKKTNVDKFAIVFISGDIPDLKDAVREAMRLKFSTRVVVIGLGKDVDRDQLIKLASYKNKHQSDISHVLPLSSSSKLVYVLKKLFMQMCRP